MPEIFKIINHEKSNSKISEKQSKEFLKGIRIEICKKI